MTTTTRDRSSYPKIKEAAALIRTDIKTAQAAGQLPKGRFSVRFHSFLNGGGGIDIRLVDLPFDVLSHSSVVLCIEDGVGGAGLSEAAARVVALTKSIAEKYRYDFGDPMSDLVDTNFYLDVSVDGALREREFARVRARDELPALVGDDGTARVFRRAALAGATDAIELDERLSRFRGLTDAGEAVVVARSFLGQDWEPPADDDGGLPF